MLLPKKQVFMTTSEQLNLHNTLCYMTTQQTRKALCHRNVTLYIRG